MGVLRERCAALVISKRDVKACVRTPDPHRKGNRSQEVRTFASMTNALLELKDWLISERVSVVTMEATGDYWKPAYYLLEDAGFELMLVNARDAKGLPGRKTDVSDSAWLVNSPNAGYCGPRWCRPSRSAGCVISPGTGPRRSGNATGKRNGWRRSSKTPA